MILGWETVFVAITIVMLHWSNLSLRPPHIPQLHCSNHPTIIPLSHQPPPLSHQPPPLSHQPPPSSHLNYHHLTNHYHLQSHIINTATIRPSINHPPHTTIPLHHHTTHHTPPSHFTTTAPLTHSIIPPHYPPRHYSASKGAAPFKRADYKGGRRN